MRRSSGSNLVRYPPEKLYQIKKPGDAPKMTPGDHSTSRYCTYRSGGDTAFDQLLLCDSTSMLKAPCAERWTSAPVRTCLHVTASLTVPIAPTLRRLISHLCYTRSEATSYCAYPGRRQGSRGSHTQACSASSVLCA